MLDKNVVYVARITTYYEIIAVSPTREGAINLVAKKALKYLKDAGVTEHKTIKDVIDYFSPNTTKIEIGKAEFEGNS